MSRLSGGLWYFLNCLLFVAFVCECGINNKSNLIFGCCVSAKLFNCYKFYSWLLIWSYVGVSYTLPDGQLAMRAFDNGAGHACSESFKILSFHFTLYSWTYNPSPHSLIKSAGIVIWYTSKVTFTFTCICLSMCKGFFCYPWPAVMPVSS